MSKSDISKFFRIYNFSKNKTNEPNAEWRDMSFCGGYDKISLWSMQWLSNPFQSCVVVHVETSHLISLFEFLCKPDD